jgi:hypothetical protein
MTFGNFQFKQLNITNLVLQLCVHCSVLQLWRYDLQCGIQYEGWEHGR